MCVSDPLHILRPILLSKSSCVIVEFCLVRMYPILEMPVVLRTLIMGFINTKQIIFEQRIYLIKHVPFVDMIE
jgi:hypothetical protein